MPKRILPRPYPATGPPVESITAGEGKLSLSALLVPGTLDWAVVGSYQVHAKVFPSAGRRVDTLAAWACCRSKGPAAPRRVNGSW